MSRLKSARLGEAGTLSIGGETFEPSPGLLPGTADFGASKCDIWGSRVACAEIAAGSAKCWRPLKVGTTQVSVSRVFRIASSPSRLAPSVEATAWGNQETAQISGAKKRILIALTIFPRCHLEMLRCE